MLEQPGKKFAERPLECTECKKAIAIYYTEVVGDQITHTCMCADCPEYRRRLYGGSHLLHAGSPLDGGAALACGNCGTTLEAVRMGTALGCSSCYEVFGDVILAELQAAHKIPARITSLKKTAPIHIGRAPGEILEINPSLRLLALNEALSETLQREDYEQAAWLRDQIKELTENEQGKKKDDNGK